MRTGRTDGTTTYSYIYSGSQLAQMKVGSNTLNFTYDAAGIPLTVTYNGTKYYYTTNIQGDVVAILNADGTTAASYTYDAWGNCLTAPTSGVGLYNPLRYRGYVYDRETELYYLQSRYYDPELGRFLNADGLVSTGQGLLGNNMFAYCLNSPVSCADSSGTRCVPLHEGGSVAQEIPQYPFKTAEDAAAHFAITYYSSSRYIRHEIGTEIFSYTINGETYYGYNQPRAGEPHSVRVGISPPPGAKLVAYVHTHPNSNYFSPDDIKATHALKGIDAYVIGPNHILQRYIYSVDTSIAVNVITPTPLTDDERIKLVETFAASWDYHINGSEDCDFGCRTITWPTAS